MLIKQKLFQIINFFKRVQIIRYLTIRKWKIAFASENMWQVCVCDQPIPKQSVVRFKFQILQMHQLYSGICFRDIISKIIEDMFQILVMGIKYNYTRYYLMCKDGYVYSHHDKEKWKSLGFKYAVNDIIEITVDLKNQIINWSNQGKNLSYTLNIENKSELYPCFRMASSKVSLIER